MERNPVVYILASPNKRALYIGITTDLSRRLEEHRQGKVHHTARYNIKCLIYFEAHETAPDAIARGFGRDDDCEAMTRSLHSALRAPVGMTVGVR